MRRLILAAAASAATVSTASAQFGTPGQPVSTAVARPILQPVGTRLPAAAPQVGTRIEGLATPTPVTPGVPGMNPQPQGKPIDLTNVVAPYPGMTKQEDFFDRLERRWFALFESDMPAERPNYTPGIYRRNHDRREREQLRRLRD